MSHFSVLVITNPGQSVEKLLEPFFEENEEQFVFQDRTEEIKSSWEKEEDKEDYESFEDYATNYFGFEENPKQPGRWGYFSNPNGKYDWYDAGGRWDGEINTLSGELVNKCLVSEIDWTPPQSVINGLRINWEVVVEGKEEPGVDCRIIRILNPSKEELLSVYKTKENYINSAPGLSAYAIVTPEGEWLEPGEMGLFGVGFASEEDTKKFQDNFKDVVLKYPDATVTMVDCHV